MFDISFGELFLIGTVALVVIGPEKLPKVARTLGHLLGRAQRYVNDVKSDINREMQLDELRKLQSQVVDSARAMENSVRQEFDSARASIGQPIDAAVNDVRDALDTNATPNAVATQEAAPVAPEAPAAPAAVAAMPESTPKA